MTKQDIIDYVVTTPHNPNKAVLSTMLNEFAAGAAAEADADDPVAESITITENGTTIAPEGTVYDEVVVNVPAPLSDITTAEVILENNEALYTWTIYAPVLDSNAVIVDEVSGGGTFTMPLYKGRVILDGTDYAGGVPTITGDCTYENNNFIITGDCTIVFA